MTVEHAFACRRCGAEAGRVAVYAAGEVVPARSPDDAVSQLFDNLIPDRPRLVVQSAVASLGALEFDVDAAVAAIAAGDAERLHRLDIEFVPFWCRVCAASYCDRHWTTWDVFDEELFDERRGRCPAGHERMVID